MTKTRKSNNAIYAIIAIAFMLCIIISMWFTYGGSPTNDSISSCRIEDFYGLIGIIFPTLLICFALKPSYTKFKVLTKDVNKRWDNTRPKSDDNKDSFLSKILYKFKLLYNTDFWITLLSTSKEKYLGFLGRFIVLLWAIGWFLYYIAIWGDFSSSHTISGTLLYSAMSSFDLFLVDINGNIIDNVKMGYLAGPLIASIGIISVLASLSLFSLVLGMFLTRLVINLKGKEVEITPELNNHIYIFFEKSDKAIALSKSILKSDPQRGLVIFVENVDLEDDDDDGWSNIVKVFSTHDKLRYDNIGYSRQIHLKTHISIESAHEQCKNGITDSIWEALGLSEISERMTLLSTLKPHRIDNTDENYQNELHIFFLSDNRNENILHTKTLSESFRNNVKTCLINKTIYCSTRRDSVTNIIEDTCSSKEHCLRTRIIDDAQLSIESLKRDSHHHPINFVSIDCEDNLGTVNSPFTSLIIGFGETGRDALRFLYEFGAFVDSSSPKDYVDGRLRTTRSPFCCHVIDKNMSELEGKFVFNTPAINHILSSDNCSIFVRQFIRYYNIDEKSIDFERLLNNISSTLNYVIVCAGDDELNISIAINILKTARRTRDNFRNFKIYVRVYEKSSFSYLSEIASYYNTISGVDDVICLFGGREELFSYDMIINDEHSIKAKEFHNAYQKIGGGKTWETLLESLNKADSMESIFDYKRKINQSRSNSLHIETKWHIFNTIIKSIYGNISDSEIKKIILNIINREHHRKGSKKDLSYTIKNLEKTEQINLLLRNLAKLEHLRWNAAHELLGFRANKEDMQDIKKLLHNCLIPWEDLANLSQYDYMLFDYQVVETSLTLSLNKVEEQTEATTRQQDDITIE